jgi:hypothetical protein
LWVACCERFLRFETADYAERAWCRLEVLLAYVFSFADHQTVIDETFFYRWPHEGRLESSRLGNPDEGLSTLPEDLERIRGIHRLCREFEPVARDRQTELPLPSPHEQAARVSCFRL